MRESAVFYINGIMCVPLWSASWLVLVVWQVIGRRGSSAALAELPDSLNAAAAVPPEPKRPPSAASDRLCTVAH